MLVEDRGQWTGLRLPTFLEPLNQKFATLLDNFTVEEENPFHCIWLPLHPNQEHKAAAL